MSIEHLKTYWSAPSILRTYQTRREAFLSNPAVREQFEASRARITRLLAETEWWHGTGIKIYRPADASTAADTATRPADMVALVLRSLDVRQDIWYTTFKDDRPVETLSITRTRMYAKVFALRYFCEHDGLEFEYGSNRFWVNCVMGRMWLEGMMRPQGWALLARQWAMRLRAQWHRPTQQARQRSKAARLEAIKKWADDFRCDGNFHIMRSDIEGNGPMLVGIRRGAISPIPANSPEMGLYESRVDAAIPPSAFGYLEVPLSRVDNVRRVVEALGMRDTLPVVPMEFVELVQSELPFESLIRPDLAAARTAFTVHGTRRLPKRPFVPSPPRGSP